MQIEIKPGKVESSMQLVSKISRVTFDFNEPLTIKYLMARCLVQYLQIFSSFLIFCYSLTRLKACEASCKI